MKVALSIVAFLVGILASCSSLNTRNFVHEDILIPFSSKQIESLEKNRAGLSEWIKAAGAKEQLARLDEVKALTSTIEVNQAEVAELAGYLRTGSVWHFGFELNFHCLAAFNERNELEMLIKW